MTTSSGEPHGERRLQRLRSVYQVAAIQWLTTSLLVLVTCVAAGVVFRWRDERRAHELRQVFNPLAIRFLPHDEARDLFLEFERFSSSVVSRPWVGFSEQAWRSRNLNVIAAVPIPVRATSQPSADADRPTLTVWVFGGSTAFGYGVPDDQTLPSHVQKSLQLAFPDKRIVVTNHAHLGYFSSQEAALFFWLLRSGRRADLAIFVDGLNDSSVISDRPNVDFDETVSAADEPMIRFSDRFPPMRVARALRKRINGETTSSWPPHGNEIEPFATMAVARYRANVRLIRAAAAAFGIRTLFVWQPTPYDFTSIDARDETIRRLQSLWRWDPVLAPMNKRVRSYGSEEDFLFMADLFADRRFADTYLDPLHYGDAANRDFGAAIVRRIVERNILPAQH